MRPREKIRFDESTFTLKTLEQITREHIILALSITRGNQRKAADLVGCSVGFVNKIVQQCERVGLRVPRRASGQVKQKAAHPIVSNEYPTNALSASGALISPAQARNLNRIESVANEMLENAFFEPDAFAPTFYPEHDS
jgi:hypothetical protein